MLHGPHGESGPGDRGVRSPPGPTVRTAGAASSHQSHYQPPCEWEKEGRGPNYSPKSAAGKKSLGKSVSALRNDTSGRAKC